MKERRLSTLAGVSGIGAVLAYVAATGLGGILRPGYSHVSHDISKLTEAGAPNRNLPVLIYSGYNLLPGGSIGTWSCCGSATGWQSTWP